MNPGGRDAFVWMQNAEPIGLYCADETDGESLRACEQVCSRCWPTSAARGVIPSLAPNGRPIEDLTEWTFTLRDGVKFHDGATLDANDVVVLRRPVGCRAPAATWAATAASPTSPACSGSS